VLDILTDISSMDRGESIGSMELEKGILTSTAAGAPLRLVFPATLAGRWRPGLFPEQP
jgi:hypothetical protein